MGKAKFYIDVIKEYLEIEALLGQMFKEIDYCMPNCIKKEESKIISLDGKKIPGIVGCCFKDFSNDNYDSGIVSRIDKERIEIYGEPNTNDICGYHTDSGCILKTHKPVKCVVYICPHMVYDILIKYNIEYDREATFNFLKDTLNENINAEDVEDFKERISDNIARIKAINEKIETYRAENHEITDGTILKLLERERQSKLR